MSLDVITKDDLQQFRLQLLQDFKVLLMPPPAAEGRRWLRSREVRRMLQISAGTLQHLRVTGRLQPRRIGRMYFYPVEAIERLLCGDAPVKGAR